MSIYVTYLTFYSGNLLPPFYIGSSSENKILSNYHGSVESKKYKKIWNNELKNNPKLFKTIIITRHTTREAATKKELSFQIKLGVVKSSMYVNLALARPNGFFGRDVSGKNNPMYNPNKEMRKLLSEKAKGRTMSEKGRLSVAESNRRRRKHPIKEKPIRINEKLIQSEETRRKNSESSCKYIYLITFPNGDQVHITNIKKFAKEYNLNPGSLYSIINGDKKRKTHKKFKAERIGFK